MRHSLKKKRNESHFQRGYEELAVCVKTEQDGEIDLYYFDESGFSQKSNLPYGWSEKGITIECPAYQNSKKLNVLGFLSRQGNFIYHEVECAVNTDIVIEAFEIFAKELPSSKKTIVYVDNAPTHTSEKFVNHAWLWLEQYKLEVRYLPTYSPELNIIEMLWKKIKYEWLSISAYETYSKLKKAVETILDDYPSKYEITFS